jgi:hypothetical protein
MTWLAEVLVVGAAAYYLWYLVGQAELTQPVRDRVFGLTPHLRSTGWLKQWLWKLVTCPWCLGAWIAIGLSTLSTLAGWTSTPWLLLALSSATTVGIIANRS